MKLPTINLEELEARKQQNFKERLAFTKAYAAKLKKGMIQEEETTN